MRSWPQITLAAGPVEATERTLRDQSRPVLYHYDPAFIDFFELLLQLGPDENCCFECVFCAAGYDLCRTNQAGG